MGTVENRKGHCALVATIIAFAPIATNALGADPPAGPAPHAPRFHVRIEDDKVAAVVREAVAGAYERLSSSSCQQVFSDFRTPDGQQLDQVLAAGGWTGQDYLSLVLFYDGSRTVHCNLGDRYAITQPGSRVVFICARKFVQKQEWNPTAAAALIIHEMLHSLGLGENPPSSVAITAGVLDRCDWKREAVPASPGRCRAHLPVCGEEKTSPIPPAPGEAITSYGPRREPSWRAIKTNASSRAPAPESHQRKFSISIRSCWSLSIWP